MSKIYFLIDGFNLYHAIAARPCYKRYRWLSLTRLCNCFIRKADAVVGIEYFTTLATWDPQKTARHRKYIKAQENDGVRITYGSFKRKDRTCRICKKTYHTFEEKQTDVNIALRLFQIAVQDGYDKAIIVSGDSDLLPSIKAVQSTFPSKQIGVIVPIGRASEELIREADFHYRMKEKHLRSSRYPDEIILRDGSILSCPVEWL
jgi:uncharacterized LabA/DUF88 family protein